MKRIKCIDAVDMIVDEATARFAPTMKEDPEAREALRQIYELFDIIAEEFDGEAFEIEVNDITTEIKLSIICHEFMVDNISGDKSLYAIMSAAKSFAITQSKEVEDCVEIVFTFNGIWERAF